jgi:2,3-bisphosphoglycerate-independent phosphoglycerate mutase
MLNKLIASVVIVTAFASCGLFRKSTKHVEKHSLEVVSKRDSTLSEKTQVDSLQRTVKVDKGAIVTETETTTVTEKKGSKVSGSIGVEKVKSGAEILLKDSAGFKILVQLDTLKQTLTVKSESPGDKITQHTKQTVTEHKDYKEENEKKGSEHVEKQVATSQEHRQKESTKIQDIQKEPKGTSFIYFWVAIALASCLIIWWVRRK